MAWQWGLAALIVSLGTQRASGVVAIVSAHNKPRRLLNNLTPTIHLECFFFIHEVESSNSDSLPLLQSLQRFPWSRGRPLLFSSTAIEIPPRRALQNNNSLTAWLHNGQNNDWTMCNQRLVVLSSLGDSRANVVTLSAQHAATRVAHSSLPLLRHELTGIDGDQFSLLIIIPGSVSTLTAETKAAALRGWDSSVSLRDPVGTRENS
ncbi:hypothetical protein EJ08DRAFT_701434 [Tothia fuscella]|uniref:Uncharacterized protein n=1 Tax=Tothia fuscella TaxID=1048955 RepID=A0A9P4TU84_9PEZI|nr:hypothetical protein EJ08DRAFT_701434 [Tothia fuscella]